ncbi:AfsR/SARP family transcriptional regulator [Pararobbsia silviterrae]|uniref:AfsR/SARP family transcriptional regulator n=1 Tax=Pararobbsia silviterrae TaxID=1792498 RepID=UPI001314D878|nr:bacterial transcriptional activator domain-containing protein [Pararobbsia silviterrae]
MLAYLALERGFHTRDSLAELFWPNEPTVQGRDKLKRMVFELREALGDACIEGDRYVVRLAPISTVWVDAIAFETDTDPVIPMVDDAPGLSGDADRASEALDRCARAIELYRGPLLQGLRIDDAPDFDIWLDSQREAYARRLVFALTRLARERARMRRIVEAIRYARRLVELAPHHEPGWQLLIDLLVRSGRRDEALHELERCRGALARELDAEPHASTLALVEQHVDPGPAAESGSEPVPASASGLNRSANRNRGPGSSRGPSSGPDSDLGSGVGLDPSPSPAFAPASASTLVSVPRAQARLAIGVAHLIRARTRRALTAFEAVLVAQPDQVIDLTFGADARTMALAWLAIARWQAGHAEAAVAASAMALERARRVADPHALAHALVVDGALSRLHGNPDRALGDAAELSALIDAHRLPHWRPAADVLSAGARAALGWPHANIDAGAATRAFNATMGAMGAVLLMVWNSHAPV